MNISDMITNDILFLMRQSSGVAQIRRNEMALRLGCVPSQINYVIASRFTPEQGYIVESKRGGGGFIRIIKVKLPAEDLLTGIINSVGDSIDEYSVRIILNHLHHDDLLGENEHKLMMAALSDTTFRSILSQKQRGSLRANIFKNMLLALLNKNA